MNVSIVNMIPEALSNESNHDFEPSIAVDPANPLVIAASAMTPGPDPGASERPIYLSSDGGLTWTLPVVVPDSDNTALADITLRFASSSNRLYVSFLNPPEFLDVARSVDLTFGSDLPLISTLTSVSDQPYIEAATVVAGPAAGKDRVYIGFNNENQASMHYSLDAASPSPVFRTVALESRGPAPGILYRNLPQIRPAVHLEGYVYAVFYSVTVESGTSPTVDVVIVRDNQWGAGDQPFTDLKDLDDGYSGQRIVKDRVVGPTSFEGEGGGGELSIAVDPNDPATVYVAWADTQPTTGYTLHVQRSIDWGQHWDAHGDLRTIPNAINPALAVNSQGELGFLFQQYVEHKKAQRPFVKRRWETHFQVSGDLEAWADLLLATVPPETASGARLGDYVHLVAVGTDFYGVFCAANRPVPANFPSTPNLDNLPNGIVYQRKHDFSTKRLLAIDGTTEVPVSIDPYFFKVSDISSPLDRLKNLREVSIDPLALLLPSDVYGRLVEKFHPHEARIADIRAVAASMTVEEKATALARARLLGSRSRDVIEAIQGSGARTPLSGAQSTSPHGTER